MSSKHFVKSTVKNKEGYDKWSEFYDSYPNPTVAMDERNFPNFWRHHTAEKILEIGCGTGRHTKKLVAHGNQVTALDLSSGMLEVARKKIPSSSVKFIEADFLGATTFESDFDVVIESLVLEHVQDLPSFFRKASSVLKTSGDLYLSEIHPERTKAGIMAHFKAANKEEVHLTSFPHSEDEILTAANTAGFKLLNTEEFRGDLGLQDLNAKWAKYLDMPMIKVWHFSKR